MTDLIELALYQGVPRDTIVYILMYPVILTVIATARQEIMQPLHLTGNTVMVDLAERKTYLVPTIKVGDNYVDVMWLNSRVADMSVSFIDSRGGKTVFRDDLKDKIRVEKRYNLSNLDRGSYTVVVSTPDHTHYERLIVE